MQCASGNSATWRRNGRGLILPPANARKFETSVEIPDIHDIIIDVIGGFET